MGEFEKKRSSKDPRESYMSRMCGGATVPPIATKVCSVPPSPDVIMCVKFGVDQTRIGEMGGGRKSPFRPIVLGAYNTLSIAGQL